MGGYGSGQWSRLGTKQTVDSQYRVDVRWLKQQGRLHSGAVGSLFWTRSGKKTGSIRYRMERDRMVLLYGHRPLGGELENVEQGV